jgi:hypothetical protein
MKKAFLLALLAAAVAVPAALADTTPQAPAAYCAAHKADLVGIGKTYATMRACLKKQTAQTDLNTVNAAKACIAERGDAGFAAGHGGKTFDQFYGSNADNGKGKGNGNAFGMCVSTMAKATSAEQQTAQTNAAKKCRTPELKTLIGTGQGKKYRNFGACVAAQSKTTG